MNYQYQKAIAVLVLIAIVVGAVAIIALVVNTFVCNNCLLGGGQAQPISGKAGTLVSLDSSDETPPFNSYETVKKQFGDIPGLSGNNNIPSRIYFIQGQNLDENGWAEKWMFEIKTNEGTQLAVYDRHGWSVIPWNVQHTMEEINIETLKSPTDLFSQNAALILSNGSVSSLSSRDIELRGNVYTLTINSPDASSVMTFDATTGALIE